MKTTHLAVGKEAVVKQSNEKHYKDQTAALLVRISRDDGEEGESNSIQTQKKLLSKVAKERGYTELLVFSDDGVTGTTMKRPGFQAMIQEIERGNIGAVFVKDLSRLGRNYREVGYYMEEFFPEHDVRLVAVSDGVDTAEGEDELAPFRNIMKGIRCLRQVKLTSLKIGISACKPDEPIVNINLLLPCAIDMNAFPDLYAVNQFINGSAV